MDMRLDITFHDPNTPEDTYKMVTKVFSEAWVKRLIDDMKSGPTNRYIITADLSI